MDNVCSDGVIVAWKADNLALLIFRHWVPVPGLS